MKNALMLAAYISIALIRFAAEYGPSQRVIDSVHPALIFDLYVSQIVFAFTSISVVVLWICSIATSPKFPFVWVVPALIPFAFPEELADKMNGASTDYLINMGGTALVFVVFTAIVYGIVALTRWLQRRSRQRKPLGSATVGDDAQVWPPPPTSKR